MNLPPNSSRTPALRWLSLLAILLALNCIQSARAQSYALTNLWSITPVTNTILNSVDNLSRGMAYNPATGHLLVVSRTPVPDFGTNVFGTNGVYILNATNGAVVGKLAFDTNVINSGTFVVNMVGVTDDGVIYVGNLTTDAAVSTTPFKLYRWASETSQPTVAYSGDPSGNYQLGASPRRFGDSLAVRGTGAGTQILLGTYNQTVGLLTTTDGANFTASLIRVSMAISDSRWGLAWGTGNTFWVKQTGYHLRQMSLDIAAKGASILRTIVLATNAPPSWAPYITTNSVLGGPLDVDPVRNLVAILDTTSHKLALYDISDLSNPIKQYNSRSLPLAGANGNSTGAVALRNGMLFALESNKDIPVI